jgi:hypothetical protein
MSTIKTPVHILADKMTVHNGPSLERLLSLPRWEDCYSPKACRVKMTLTTTASTRDFVRNVTITLVAAEYEPFEPLDMEDFFHGPRATGKYHICGFIGDWYFTGIYDPRTRTSTLTEVEYDPAQEAELDRLDGIEQEAIRQRGGL